MTELEIMRHAKGYLDKLAEGVDPLTGELAGETDLVRKERIAKCLRYVSGVLDRVIALGGLPTQPAQPQPVPSQPAPQKRRLPPFAVSPDALAGFRFSPAPITMTELTKRINDLVDPEAVDRLKAVSILEYLEAQSYLQLTPALGKRGARRPTAAGEELGISLAERQSPDGGYTVVVYNENAQAYVLAHMEEITARNSEKYRERTDARALQGTPWTQEQDAKLRELCQSGLPLAEIARQMQRSCNGIHYRLQHLGLEIQQRP